MPSSRHSRSIRFFLLSCLSWAFLTAQPQDSTRYTEAAAAGEEPSATVQAVESAEADGSAGPADSLSAGMEPGSSAGDSTGHPSDSAGHFESRRLENNAFKVGEHLEFVIAFGIIKAGTATMSIPSMETVKGRPCFRILTTAESNAFFSKLYKVRDWVESILDAQGLFSWKFRKHLREGRYKADRSAEFDPAAGRVMTPHDTLASPPYVLDILASFYYSRTRPLEPGSSFDIDSFSDNKIYPLRVLVHRRERIKVPAGDFDCIVVEPVIRGEGLFKQKGKLTIWLTDDERRMLVLMKSKILVGSIDARLTAFRFE